MIVTDDPVYEVCAHAAIVNTLRRHKRPWPTFADLEAAFRGRQQLESGATPQMVVDALGVYGLLCGLITIPPALWGNPARVFTRLIDRGFELVIFYGWSDPGLFRDPQTNEWTIDKDREGCIVHHVTLAIAYSEDGLHCIDNDPLPQGHKISLFPSISEGIELCERAERLNQTSGGEVILPFYPVVNDPVNDVGLLPHVIAVWPEDSANGKA